MTILELLLARSGKLNENLIYDRPKIYSRNEVDRLLSLVAKENEKIVAGE